MTVTATALAATAALGAAPSTAAPQARDFNAGPQGLAQPPGGEAGAPQRLADRAASGRQAYLLTLSTTSTATAFARAGGKGATAKDAAREQLSRVEAVQDKVIAQLPAEAQVLYRTHAALPAVGVTTSASPEALEALSGVAAVHPIAPKTRSNASAVQLQGAPAAWVAQSETGAGTRVAIIDTGIDYTHANFGGPGTVAAYDAEHALADTPTNTSTLFPTAKVVDGYDLVGDDYDASEPALSTPKPDENPLDCNGHGSHVAGSAAGFGENADGTTYTGAYDTSTPFDTMKIGPGMAPEASLIALRVFGCDGSTDVAAKAIEMAVDPNGDGDPSDHVDVANMSLGSGYGSPNDGDAVMADAASKAGVVMAISAGNSGDVQDISGSPGSSVRAITVANTVDAKSVLDGVAVKIDNGAEKTYGITRSVAYDWKTKADLQGTVVQVDAAFTACAPLTSAQADIVRGKIAIVKWTQAALECGSVARSGNLANAGAKGFIFHNSEETFSAGITGSSVIPGVLIVKSGGDAIRAALNASQPVSVTGTSYGTVEQDFPGDVDTVNSSSSRGGHAAGALKPDVSAVGTSVYSTGVGTGNRGEDLSGTSMAAPMVAGLAALVKGVNPTWTTEMIKADIMNTAGQDLFLGKNHTGAKYAPNRVGSGRIQADAALANKVLAYVADGSGAVSASFGPVEVSGPTTLTKTIKVQNTGTSDATYATSYAAATTVPGTSYSVSPASVTVPAGGSANVTVTFTASGRGALTKTADPTSGRTGVAVPLPREVLSSASGRVVLKPQSGVTLRVPVYAAPRPASAMTQASELTMPTGSSSAQLALTGDDLANGALDGDASNDIFSVAAGFELTAVDGTEPMCAPTVNAGCLHLPEERFADVAHVGVTSDYPVQGSQAASQAYFAINAHGPWSTPASKIEYDVYLDVDGDKSPDLVAYTTRLAAGEDIFTVNLLDLANGAADADSSNEIFSLAAGFELTAVDGTEPMCAPTVNAGCLHLPEERFADVAHVGVTSDYPVQGSQAASQAYFAINAHGPWSTPASKIEYDVYLDVDGDKSPDLVAYTTRLAAGEDIFTVNLLNLATGKVIDTELLNNRFGDVDTAVFDSDTLIMPVWLEKLKAFGVTPANPRINYGVISYTNLSADYIDAVGMDPATGDVSLSADLFSPAVSVTDANGAGPLVLDKTGSQLTVTRNAASYAADGGKGLMMVHLHNKVGAKTQVVALKDPVTPPTTPPTTTPPTTTPAPAPVDSDTVTKVKPRKPSYRENFKVVVKVEADGTVPTGKVVLRIDGKRMGKARLKDGRVVFRIERDYAIGKHVALAKYKGSDTVETSKDRIRFRVVR